MIGKLKQMASSSNLSNCICPISKRLWLCCASGSTYYNPGPHGQHGEPGLRSGQCDSSAFLLKHFVLDMCLIIMCLLVLMGLVKGLNWRCGVKTARPAMKPQLKGAALQRELGQRAVWRVAPLLPWLILKYPAVLNSLLSRDESCQDFPAKNSPKRSDVHR